MSWKRCEHPDSERLKGPEIDTTHSSSLRHNIAKLLKAKEKENYKNSKIRHQVTYKRIPI